MNKKFFILKDGKESGPVSTEILKQKVAIGELLPNDHIRPEGQQNWIKAAKAKGLFSKTEDNPTADLGLSQKNSSSTNNSIRTGRKVMREIKKIAITAFIAAVATLVVGYKCVSLLGPSKEEKQRTAIEHVVMYSKAFWVNSLERVKDESLKKEKDDSEVKIAQYYIFRLQQISLEDCPADFVEAFQTYIVVWKSEISNAKRGFFIEAFFSRPHASSKERDATPVRVAWEHVLQIANEHGVDVIH